VRQRLPSPSGSDISQRGPAARQLPPSGPEQDGHTAAPCRASSSRQVPAPS